MRILEVAQATGRRIRRPVTWGAILVFGLLWNMSRWGLGVMHSAWPEFVAPFAWTFAFLALSPVPWQWTGDEKPLAYPQPESSLQNNCRRTFGNGKQRDHFTDIGK